MGENAVKRGRGKPVLFPDSPLHEYWRAQKKRLKAEKREAPEPTPDD